jgi:hypothetical protein
MGGGAEIIPLLISAAGTAASISAEDRSNGTTSARILNRQLERRRPRRRRAPPSRRCRRVSGTTWPTANRACKTPKTSTLAQTQADLQGAGGATINAAADAGNVSEDFLKTKAARAIEENTRLTDCRAGSGPHARTWSAANG